MIAYSLEEIQLATNASLFGDKNRIIDQVAIDSRTIVSSDSTLFFAIKGKHNDAHQFIPSLINRGIVSFVVCNSFQSEIHRYPNANFLIVDDALSAFQKFASFHRNKFNIPVIGITGSNGKTICKEWLFHLLSEKFFCLRSPKSYNSQVGVPISVSLLNEEHDFAIFEAGMSQPGEMERLEKIVLPKVGLFTNIGDAHQENFLHVRDKVKEKLYLFKNADYFIYCKDHVNIESEITDRSTAYSWSYENVQVKKTGNSSFIKVQTDIEYSFEIPFVDSASIENSLHCFYVLYSMKLVDSNLLKRFSTLPAVEMRLEQIEGENNCIIINDAYNSDIESVTIALDFLEQQTLFNKKSVIVSDIQQSERGANYIYHKLFELIESRKVTKLYCIGVNISDYFSELKHLNVNCFSTTEEFLRSDEIKQFKNEAILIKGARSFGFERITNYLKYKTHRTRLEINLTSIVDNLNYFRSLLRPETKVMAMVKGFSYGSGSHEIASVLQYNRIDYLGVAFADEGIELRNSGISIPILVLNPEPLSFSKMIRHGLEPEIYSFQILNKFLDVVNESNIKKAKIHLKFDTGMSRMGFMPEDLPKLIEKLKHCNNIIIASVFSHLAGSDSDDFDEFTLAQLRSFEKIYSTVQDQFQYNIIGHILNSAGIERFPEYQFNMVRLGIGLYGISATGSKQLRNISRLITTISQIKNFEQGRTIGYCRKWTLTRNSRVAVISIGYADGLDRRFSNGVGKVYVNGVLVPIIGNVCMDATMIDVTDVECREGDEVVVFGKENSVATLAADIGTIPYEILTNVSRRVSRIFYTD